MRRFVVFVTILLAGLSMLSAHAADPAGGTVKPPLPPGMIGPKITWVGASYVVGANTQATCGQPTDQCDIFHLSIGAPAGFWSSHFGGVIVSIDGYDANQDFDLRVYRENADGSLGQRIATSGGPAGAAEKVTVPKATGKYSVVVNPYSVTKIGRAHV